MGGGRYAKEARSSTLGLAYVVNSHSLLIVKASISVVAVFIAAY